MTLNVKVEGAIGSIDLAHMLETFREVLQAMNDVDRAVHRTEDAVLRWKVSGLKASSVALQLDSAAPDGVDVRAPVGRRQPQPTEVQRRILAEFATITTSDTSDTVFDHQRLERILKLLEKGQERGIRGFTVGHGDEQVMLDRQTATMLRRRLSNVVTSLGSVTGTVEVINARGRRWYIMLRDTVSGRMVRCYVRKGDVADVRVMRRATVTGQVKRTLDRGWPVEITHTRVEMIDEEAGQGLLDALGVDPSAATFDPVEAARRARRG